MKVRWEEREQPVYHLRVVRDDGALGPQMDLS
jgi:hypothetical protein